MNREKFAESLEGIIDSYKEQLEKNEDSTLSNLGNMAKMGYETLKAKLSGTDEDKHVLEMFKTYADDFEDALKRQDKSTAIKALDDMKKTLQGFRINSYDTV